MRDELGLATPVFDRSVCYLSTHVDIHDAFAIGVCARYFKVPEQSVKDAITMLGDDFQHISRHLLFFKPYLVK